jgi:3-oxoacyl-[acyl-carrier protein] reductase
MGWGTAVADNFGAMDIRLDGRHALVCGATQGIGRAVAHAFAGLGARVSLLARDATKLDEVLAALPVAEGVAHARVVVDMSDTRQLEATLQGHLQTHGPVHILVNNTGGPPPGPAHQAGVEAYEQAFRLHLLSHQTLVQAVLPGMEAGGMGRIINIISTSVKQPLHGLGVSNTIRGAVANWSKTLSNELGPKGITVNNVLPGATSTERLSAIIRNKADRTGRSEEEEAAGMQAEIPLRRFARPEEIAWAVAFLAGPAGAYVNGINLPVDGGRTACL